VVAFGGDSIVAGVVSVGGGVVGVVGGVEQAHDSSGNHIRAGEVDGRGENVTILALPLQ